MKYFLVVGEKSGDLHAANLMRSLKAEDPQAEFVFWGGNDMEQAGGQLLRHYKTFSVMGIGEVIKKIPALRKAIKDCAHDILHYQPDAVIFIDSAAFNLRVAAKVKPKGIRTFYYISPKIWAWNQKRAYKVKRLIDRMFVIMAFEPEFYQKYGYEASYVGNPIFDAIQSFTPAPNFLEDYGLVSDKKILALLPGSREQELRRILPPMAEAAKRFLQKHSDYQVVVSGVSNLEEFFYKPAADLGFPVIHNATYDLLHRSHLAIVTSGTATLETALFKVPQVVAYKTSPLTYLIGKMVLKIPYISLVNLTAEKLLAEEVLQKACTGEGLFEALERLLPQYGQAKEACDELYEHVKTEGASLKTAKLMVEDLRGRGL